MAAQKSGQAVSDAVKALSANLAGADVPVDGESVATGKAAAGLLDKNVAPLTPGKLPTPNKVWRHRNLRAPQYQK